MRYLVVAFSLNRSPACHRLALVGRHTQTYADIPLADFGQGIIAG
jgi:hypothetical protein